MSQKKGGLELTSAIFPAPRPVSRVHVPLYTVSKMHIPTIMIILWQELFNRNDWGIQDNFFFLNLIRIKGPLK